MSCITPAPYAAITALVLFACLTFCAHKYDITSYYLKCVHVLHAKTTVGS